MTETDNDSHLLMDDIQKEFGQVVANDAVTLSVDKGEIHGLLGENGAGKSTLMKILHGKYKPDDGSIYIDGKEVVHESQDDAMDNGIGMVHQHFRLVPRLSVLENIILGQEEPPGKDPTTGLQKIKNKLTIDRGSAERKISYIVDKYGFDIDVSKKVYELDLREKQIVEIIKSLYRDVDILILDEPTAVLPPHQLEDLLETIEGIASDDVAVIFITHKLKEVTAVTDRITVLRDGRVVDTVTTDDVSRSELARLMIGEEIALDINKPESQVGDVIFDATNLHATDERGIQTINNVDISLRSGEIAGVAGIGGNGPNDLLRCLAGVKSLDRGRITVGGTDLTDADTAAFVEAGISYIPEDRLESGCAPSRNVSDNIIIKEVEQFQNYGMLDREKVASYAADIIDLFDVKLSDEEADMRTLSGGNVQKAIIGRELYRDPKIIVANKPTRGVDVGAIEFIRNRLIDACETGSSVLFHSENLDEIFQLSDRVLVMHDGKIVHEATSDAPNRDRISQLMLNGEAT